MAILNCTFRMLTFHIRKNQRKILCSGSCNSKPSHSDTWETWDTGLCLPDLYQWSVIWIPKIPEGEKRVL